VPGHWSAPQLCLSGDLSRIHRRDLLHFFLQLLVVGSQLNQLPSLQQGSSFASLEHSSYHILFCRNQTCRDLLAITAALPPGASIPLSQTLAIHGSLLVAAPV
jgi:hypothetical protein